MTAGTDDVRYAGKAGSGRRHVKTTRLTHVGSGACITAVETMRIDPAGEMPASIAVGQERKSNSLCRCISLRSYCLIEVFRPAESFLETRSGFLGTSWSRNSRRRILPTFDFGSASMNCTIFGVLYAVISLRQCVTRSSFVNVAFGALTTNSLTASPVFSSGTPMQAHSITPGHAVATASTSLG